MLKSGGRMANCLPQGRFNNSSEKVYSRFYNPKNARILTG